MCCVLVYVHEAGLGQLSGGSGCQHSGQPSLTTKVKTAPWKWRSDKTAGTFPVSSRAALTQKVLNRNKCQTCYQSQIAQGLGSRKVITPGLPSTTVKHPWYGCTTVK